MGGRVEIFVGVVDKIDGPVSKAGAASAILDQYNTDAKGFVLINQGAQTGAAIASVISITKMTAGFVPFLNISANTLAGTTTFLKIVADYKSDKPFNAGDHLSLIGNVAGVVASFALLGGAVGVAAGFTAVAITASLINLYSPGLVQSLYDQLVSPVVKALQAKEIHDYGGDLWVAPDLTLASVSRISTNHSNSIAVVKWDPGANSVTLGSVDFGAYSNSSTGEVVFGGGAIGPPAVIPQLPEVIGRVDIGLPIITGQDKYACCNAPQQDKYPS